MNTFDQESLFSHIAMEMIKQKKPLVIPSNDPLFNPVDDDLFFVLINAMRLGCPVIFVSTNPMQDDLIDKLDPAEAEKINYKIFNLTDDRIKELIQSDDDYKLFYEYARIMLAPEEKFKMDLSIYRIDDELAYKLICTITETKEV